MKTLEELRDYTVEAATASASEGCIYYIRKEYNEASFYEGMAFAYRNLQRNISKMIKEQAQ